MLEWLKSKFSKKLTSSIPRIPMGSIDAPTQIAKSLVDVYAKYNRPTEDVIFLCIGSVKISGDALGPIVGDLLKMKLPNVIVYGTSDYPVHAVNLISIIERIPEDRPVIVIDACLGKISGTIIVHHGACLPGSASGKELPEIGNISVLGVVNTEDAHSDYFTSLLSVDHRLVEYMATIITQGIEMWYKNDIHEIEE